MTPMEDVAIYFQGYVFGPLNAEMTAAIGAWTLHESGPVITGNNPWNLHIGPPCPVTSQASVLGLNPSQVLLGANGLIGNRYAGPGDQNVAIFNTLSGGVKACIDNLVSHGSDWAGYDKVLAAARTGSGVDFLNALAASAWSAGRYGTLNSAPNVLLPIYYKLLGESNVLATIEFKIERWTLDGGPGKVTTFGAPYAADGTVDYSQRLAFFSTAGISGARLELIDRDNRLTLADISLDIPFKLALASYALPAADIKHHVTLSVDSVEVFKEDV